jgi:hypothetical protein
MLFDPYTRMENYLSELRSQGGVIDMNVVEAMLETFRAELEYANDVTYDHGYMAGYDEGYTEGYAEGYNETHDDGEHDVFTF